MAKSISVKHQKKRPRGRPPTGHEYVGIRLQPSLIKEIDAWAKRQGAASRSDAIRRLIEQSLAGSQPQRKRSEESASEARAMARRTLEDLGDKSLPVEERVKRRRRITRGPQEFREMRDDLPKPKG
jgi:hypothetical protein